MGINELESDIRNRTMRYRLFAERLPNRLLALLASLVLCIPVFSFAKETRNPQLFAVRVDGSGLEQLTHQPDWHFGASQWSPDGRRIAVDGWLVEEFKKQSYSATHLFVMNADGSDSMDIGLGAMPSWSPDGRQLVCHTYLPSSSIVVMNADGTGREEVANHWGSPRWLPTGNRIATLSRNGLATLDLMTGLESSLRVPRIHSPKLGFSCSPEGQQICFSDRSARGLVVASFDETWKYQSVRYFATSFECAFSSWSPDGKQIVFSAKPNREEKKQLYVLTVASKDPPVRLQGQPENVNNIDPDWSPDGKWILFSSDVKD